MKAKTNAYIMIYEEVKAAIEFFKTKVDISEQCESELLRLVRIKQYKRGERVYTQGESSGGMYIVLQGLLREYRLTHAGRDISIRFVPERNFTSSLPKYEENAVARASCEALEKSIVACLNFDEIWYLVKLDHGFAALAIHMLYAAFEKASEFIVDLKFRSAREKYQSLIAENPSFPRRIPAVHLASYLGVAAETLSRVKSGKL